RPVMKFGIFTGVTVALFALGLYSEHRWRLATTSRGILLIATLLVPLNFIAYAALSAGRSPSSIALGGELLAVGLFALLVFHSAKVLSPTLSQLLIMDIVGLPGSLYAIEPFGCDL